MTQLSQSISRPNKSFYAIIVISVATYQAFISAEPIFSSTSFSSSMAAKGSVPEVHKL
jgi:hypothetical protein